METGTTVTKSTVGADVLDMFPGIDVEDVLTKPTNILNGDGDLSFLDKPGAVKLDPPAAAAPPANETPEAKEAREKKEAEDKAKAVPVGGPKADADKILDSLTPNEGADDEGAAAAAADDSKKTGRDGITSYLKSKIEAGTFSAFEDWDEKKETLDAYLAKQPIKTLHEMLDANWDAKEKDLLEQTPKEFFEALPPELQYAARYVMDGGTDMKGIFTALAQVEQVKALDITTEDGQIATARAYLQATGFGGGKPERIEKQVNEWKEAGKLEEKAAEFKPDLDEMQKEQVEYRLQQQATFNKQQRDAAQAYMGNVGKALEKGEINGIKLDRKTATNLYAGLTNVSYPSASGRPTNLLGHLLDKIQYVEPNFALLAEVTYLLSDPEGYRNSIKQLGANAQVADTVRKLKTEQQTSGGQAAADGGGDDDPDKKKGKKLAKPANMFAGWTK